MITGIEDQEVRKIVARNGASLGDLLDFSWRGVTGLSIATSCHPGNRASARLSGTHMWTAPDSQEVLQSLGRIACNHMSGLFDAVVHDRWPRWFPRREFQTNTRLVPPLGPSECLALWVDRTICSSSASSGHPLESCPVQPISSTRPMPARVARARRRRLHRSPSASRRCGRSCWRAPPPPAGAACA